jgi:hypothetical protein
MLDRKVNILQKVNLWTLLILAAILVIMLNGCGEYEPNEMEIDTTENISVNTTDDKIQSSNLSAQDITQIEPIIKNWNPKISYRLAKIIESYENGQLDDYSYSRMIQIKDESIYVLITSYPGKLKMLRKK